LYAGILLIALRFLPDITIALTFMHLEGLAPGLWLGLATMQTTRNGYMMTFSDSIQPTGQIYALIFGKLLTQLVHIWLFGGATEGQTSSGLLTRGKRTRKDVLLRVAMKEELASRGWPDRIGQFVRNAICFGLSEKLND
jgi:hypothetical protein